MNDNIVKISCGINDNKLGSPISGDTKFFTEIGNLICGNMILGSLDKLETYYSCETPSLKEMYEKYRYDIKEGDNLYFIDSNALSGTIYTCVPDNLEVWTIFANTAGYA